MTQDKSVNYSDTKTPDWYSCAECGATNVRLYREYQTFLNYQILRCRKCALINQNCEQPDSSSEHSIKWLVAAVPTEDGLSYWGYTSVPGEGVQWWNNLDSGAALVTMNGQCNHTWKEIEDQSTKEDFTQVKCLKCGIFGELDNQNNEITITS